MSDNKYMDKIIKLLAQAESTDNPEEAKTFSAKAQELMSEWEIDEAEMEARRRAGDKTATGKRGELVSEFVTIIGVMERAYKVELWFRVATLNGVRTIQMTGSIFNPDSGKNEKGVRLEFLGYENDIHMTKMMVTSLLIQAEREYRTDAVQDQARWECSHPAHWIKWKNGFMMGYAEGVTAKLKAAKRTAQTQHAPQDNSTALVLRSKKTEVDEFVSKKHPKLGTADRSTAGRDSGSASTLGYRAGQRADTGAGRVGGSTRKEL